MASPKKNTEGVTDVESVEKKATKKQVSDNTLNKDGFKKGASLTAEEYAKYKAKLK